MMSNIKSKETQIKKLFEHQQSIFTIYSNCKLRL